MKVPKMTREEVENLLIASGVEDKNCIVGIRGYYRDSMGAVGVNDRGIYDDAVFVISPKMFAAFQANVDPSIYRRGIANLKVGIYKCVKWFHKGKYRALQIVRDVVQRDGQTALDAGRHGINFHFGGENQTWSEGCQTLPKSTYFTFLNLVYSVMQTANLSEITYVLIDNPTK